MKNFSFLIYIPAKIDFILCPFYEFKVTFLKPIQVIDRFLGFIDGFDGFIDHFLKFIDRFSPFINYFSNPQAKTPKSQASARLAPNTISAP
ncbi:hypothetical protein V7161_16505 [Neobacillus drentensis]